MRVWERCVVRLCERVLFIRWFKTWWPVGGSYWNERHINKQSKRDLEQVIRDANDYTKHHTLETFTLVVAYVAAHLSGTLKPEYGWLFYIGFGFQGYAFFAHEYNRIRARDALKLLPAEKEEMFRVEHFAHGNIPYWQVLSQDFHAMSPRFATQNEATQYHRFLSSKFNNVSIFDFSKQFFLTPNLPRKLFSEFVKN